MRPFEPLEWDELSLSVRKAISSDAAPGTKLAAARALLPMGTADLVSVLYFLANDEDKRIRAAARRSLTNLPKDLLAPVLADRVSPKVLNWFARRDLPDTKLFEVIALNRDTADETIEFLAGDRAEETLLTIIANNQQRLLRSEGIIRALMRNDATPLSTAERVRNFVEMASGRTVEDILRTDEPEAEIEFEAAEEEPAPVEQEPEIVEAAEVADDGVEVAGLEPDEMDDDDFGLSKDFDPELFEELERTIDLDELERETFSSESDFATEFMVDPDQDLSSTERRSLGHTIRKLPETEKMRMAMKGSIEARQILMKSPNKLVQECVLRNPRITIEEVIKLSKDKTAREEIIRVLTNNRDWTKNYQVVHNLAWNPKTPMTIALKYLHRLNLRDLTGISKSKQVPGMIAVQAKKMAVERERYR
jgi:hypothetical protein